MTNLSRYSIRQLLVTIIGLFAVVIVLITSHQTYQAWRKLDQIQELRRAITIADSLGDAVEALAIERGIIYTMLGAKQNVGEHITLQLEEQRQRSDDALQAALTALDHYHELPGVTDLLVITRQRYVTVKSLRERVAGAMEQRLTERDEKLPDLWFNATTEMIMQTQALRMGFNQHFSNIDPMITQHMLFKYFLWLVTEYASRERAKIGYLIITDQTMSAEAQKQLLLWRGIAEVSWRTTRALATRSGLSLQEHLDEAESHYFMVFDSMREVFYNVDDDNPATDYPFNIAFWEELASQAIESFFELKNESLVEAWEVLNEKETEAQTGIVTHLTVLMVTIILSLFAVWVIVYRVVRPINRTVEALFSEATRSRRTMHLSSKENYNAVTTQQNEIDKLLYVLRLHRMTGEAIRENEAQLRNIFENTIDGLITMDTDGVIIKVNPAAANIFRYEPQEIIGRNIRLLMPEAYADYVENFSSNEGKKMDMLREMEGIRKNNTTFPLEVSTSEIYLHGQQYFSSIVRDITQQKAAEIERERFLQKLKESNEELERFAYVASHDLKAPLRAIDNLSKWIEEDLEDQLKGETREYMDLMHQRVRRMEKLLDDLLEYSRIGHKMGAAYEEVVQGNLLLEDVLALTNPPKGFTIKVADGFEAVRVNRMPIQQVLYNLINNAIKHHEREDGMVEVGVKEESEFYVFTVRDDGPGIPETFHEKIFEMFKTLKPRDEMEGSGIGLAVVKKTITVMGGDITVDSAEGKGSTFRFTWPKKLQK